MQPKVIIVIPAHNEEENIPALVEEFKKEKNFFNFPFQVVIVDDGSTDNSYKIAESLANENEFLKVFRQRRRLGITQALLTGFENSSGEIYVYFPADLQYKVRDIKNLVEPIIKDEADVVTGWKRGKYEKKIVSGIYNSLSRALFKIPVHDLNSIKAFRREVVNEVPWRKDWHRYMVILAYDKGYRIKEVKVDILPRRFGRSKFGPERIPIGILDLMSVKFLTSFSKKPLLLFGSLGGISLLLGVIIGTVAVLLRIFVNFGYRPLLYLVTLLILSGLLLFALGFLSEQVAILRDELDRLRDKIK